MMGIEKGSCAVQLPFPLTFTLHGGNGGDNLDHDPRCKSIVP